MSATGVVEPVPAPVVALPPVVVALPPAVVVAAPAVVGAAVVAVDFLSLPHATSVMQAVRPIPRIDPQRVLLTCPPVHSRGAARPGIRTPERRHPTRRVSRSPAGGRCDLGRVRLIIRTRR